MNAPSNRTELSIRIVLVSAKELLERNWCVERFLPNQCLAGLTQLSTMQRLMVQKPRLGRNLIVMDGGGRLQHAEAQA